MRPRELAGKPAQLTGRMSNLRLNTITRELPLCLQLKGLGRAARVMSWMMNLNSIERGLS